MFTNPSNPPTPLPPTVGEKTDLLARKIVANLWCRYAATRRHRQYAQSKGHYEAARILSSREYAERNAFETSRRIYYGENL